MFSNQWLESNRKYLSSPEDDEGIGWVIENYFPASGLIVLAGPTGSGKSALALNLAVAMVAKGRFANLPVDCCGAVLWISGEATAAISSRLRAAIAQFNVGAKDSERAQIVDARELPIEWLDVRCEGQGEKSLSALAACIRRNYDFITSVKRFDVRINLIIIDTFAAVCGVTNENDNAAVQQAANTLVELGDDLLCPIVVLAHTKKGTSEVRGASALVGAADAVFTVERRGAKSYALVHQKSRHGVLQPPLEYRIISGKGAELDAASAPIIDWVSKAPTSRDVTTFERVYAYDLFLKAISCLVAAGRMRFGDDGSVCVDQSMVRAQFAEFYSGSADAVRKAFDRSRERALSEGKIVPYTLEDGSAALRIFDA